MSQEQNSTISGTVYDKYTKESAEYLDGNMPRVGQLCHFEDGRSFVFCHTTAGIQINDVVAAGDGYYDSAGISKIANAGTRTVVCLMSGTLAPGLINEGFIELQTANSGFPVTRRLYKVRRSRIISGDKIVEYTIYDTINETIPAGTKLTAYTARTKYCVRGNAANDGIGLSMAETVFEEDNFFWVQYKGNAVSGQNNTTLEAGALIQADGGKLAGFSELAPVGAVVVAQGGYQAGLSYHLWLCFPNI